MNSRERVLGSFNRTGYDRIPVKHEDTPEINQMIMDHYGLTNMEQLLLKSSAVQLLRKVLLSASELLMK